MDLLHPSHKRPGLLVLQSLGLKRLPEPLPTTTPPEKPVGPDGTLWMMWLLLISMPLAPSSAMPTPESGGAPSKAGHARVLFTTLLPRTSNTPAGPGASARMK